jgi:hypothetical protein
MRGGGCLRGLGRWSDVCLYWRLIGRVQVGLRDLRGLSGFRAHVCELEGGDVMSVLM